MNIITIDQAILSLKAAIPIAIPTETVYGLAALFDNEASIKAIYQLKNRPLNHPLIVHMHDINEISKYTVDVPEYVYKLAQHFSPGPLTYVLKKNHHVPNIITGGQNTVAIRIPSHHVTLRLLKKIKKPLVAPSANPYCQLSPTSSEHVFSYFNTTVPILEGGCCDIGIESTIILSTDPEEISILRPGMISAEAISEISGVPCHFLNDSKVNVPGNKKKHYAPKTPLYLINSKEKLAELLATADKNSFFLVFKKNDFAVNQKLMPNSPDLYSKQLYSILHEIDGRYDQIIVESPPAAYCWYGLIDRLTKASKLVLA